MNIVDETFWKAITRKAIFSLWGEEEKIWDKFADVP